MNSFSEFCDATILLIGAFVALLAIWVFKRKRPKNFPPGPRGLPFLGYAPFLGKNSGETLMKLKKKYGPVMSVRMGTEDWVVLNDFASINEGLVKQGEKFSGRPSNFIFQLMTEGKGLVAADYGPVWRNLRKFGLMTLRGFGVGKKSMEDNIIEESHYLVEKLEISDGNLTLRHKLTGAVSNIICRIIFGSRFDYEDERFLSLLHVIDSFFADQTKAKLVNFIALAPYLRHLPAFNGALKSIVQELNVFLDHFHAIINEHRKDFVEDELRDFIDAFLKEMKERGADNASFNDRELLYYIRVLFQAGTGTTSSTLFWSMFTLCHFPDTQDKIAKEVKDVIGESGTPSIKHRDQMPYTCAFIQEIMRLKTLVPLSVLHKTNEDATLGEYDIPKNTTISPNLWAVHHDPKIFPEPDNFQPERFLDKDGKFVKSSYVIPFSVGPRHCLGEQLARMEIFIFLTRIVQKLKITADPNVELPSFGNSGRTKGLLFEGPEFKVIFEKR